MNTLSRALLALLLAVSVTATTFVQEAEARRGRGAFIAGAVIGLGIAGALAHQRYYGPRYYSYSYGGCYKGPVQCKWVPRGCNYNGCWGGYEKCWRPTICG